MKNVLVVEHDADAAGAMIVALMKAGYAVFRAGDGGGAITIARSVPRPDLILLDLEAPGVGGTNFTAELRRGAWRGVPVIHLSAAPMIRSPSAPAPSPPPRDLDELVSQVRQILDPS